MKVFLTGSSGMLGSAINKCCFDLGIDCLAICRADISHSKLDYLCELLSSQSIIIHAAANTNVDFCEENPLQCYADNTHLTEILVTVARITNTRLVFISSTGVYGAYKTAPYIEYDIARPTTQHHKAKLMSEYLVLGLGDSLVIRTGWLFGGAPSNPKNFVARRIDEGAVTAGKIMANVSQWGNPSFVSDVAERTILMTLGSYDGVVNCVSEGSASRFQYVKDIYSIAGLKVDLEGVDSSYFLRKAKVSPNEMAENFRQKLYGLPEMRHYKDALELYILSELQS